AFAAMDATPSVPTPPGLLSTMTGCPRSLLTRLASRRYCVSGTPPGCHGITRVIGRVGYCWAATGALPAIARPATRLISDSARSPAFSRLENLEILGRNAGACQRAGAQQQPCAMLCLGHRVDHRELFDRREDREHVGNALRQINDGARLQS